ncbi:MAG: hypothetical protein A2138_01845 [Deltaproteobacteria bacterium RBG_16_71_12]|nr:MAG: hypothetical protein A2138_01845 [Deltaproteobacteria bacterium RBG_16_71_12]
MSAAVPDLVRFTSDALATLGALVDVADAGADGNTGGALAIVPPDLAKSLAIAEELQLEPGPGGAGVACVLGAKLVEDLVTRARAEAPVLWLQVERDAPRAAQAQSLATRFVVRNGVTDVGDTRVSAQSYLSLAVAYDAEADDRHEGLVRCSFHAADGAAADTLDDLDLDALDGARVSPRPLFASAPAFPVALVRVADSIAARTAGFAEQVERRHRRDHDRIAQYFLELAGEARQGKRVKDGEVLRAKLAHIVAERDKKLADLVPRFTLRLRARPALVFAMIIPTVNVEVRIRRRKEERVVALHLHALGRALDRPACEACKRAAPRPAVCDDQLHLLCEACAPQAQGRLRCPVCEQP